MAILTLIHFNKIKISKKVLLITIFFFTIIFSSILIKKKFDDLVLIRFYLISLFAYLHFDKIFYNKKKLFYIILGIIFIVSSDIVYQEVTGRNFLGYAYSGVPTGLFNGRQINGSFLSKLIIILSVISVMYMVKEKNINSNISQIIIQLTFIIGTYVIILSNERKAILDILLCFAVLTIIYFKKKILLFFLFFLIFISTIFFLKKDLKNEIFLKTFYQFGIINPIDREIGYQEKYGVLFKDTSLKNNQYYSMYITAYNIWKDNKIIGGGNRSFRELCQNPKYQYDQEYSLIRCNTHPHSIYLQILSENGIIGITLFLFLICSIFFSFFKKNKNYLTNSFFILLVIQLMPIPNGNIFSTWLGSIFWLNIGFLLNDKIVNKK
jgi:O-antigen ligase